MTQAVQLVTSVIESCEKFTTLLLEENEALKDRKLSEVEEKLKEKRHLAAKVEKLLSTLKASFTQVKNDQSATDKLSQLTTVVNNYQKAARKNTVLLQAAHTATSDFINLVRSAVESKKPKVQTYGETGNMRQTENTTKLIDKDI